MLKIAICDDDNTIINQIENILIEICYQEKIPVDIDVYYCGATIEREIVRGAKYDLLIMDIQMSGGDGITAAKNIRTIDENVLIIFASAYDEYMVELFRLDVFAFMKKPINKNALVHIFLEAHQKICKRNFYFIYRYKSVEYKVPCKEILYFESNARQVRVYLKNGEVEVFNGKLSEVEMKLGESKVPFLRIHQSYLVNYHSIKGRLKSEVKLVDGTTLPISEDRQKEFGREYVRLLGEEINV